MPHQTAPDTLALTRHALASALRGMALGAALVLLWVGWRFIGGAPTDDRPPHVRVSDVTPGSYKWSDAPLPPPGVPAAEADRYKLLVLRDGAGTVHAFYLPASDGLATVPSGSNALSPGVPCGDFAPDFRTQDIACRQSSAGFEFATRHRWALNGQPLTPGVPVLTAAPGGEEAGDWVWPVPGH